MEIHKHPHDVTHKKKWGEYFLEFCMLFLAVFLGFLAENQREHMVEHQQEKQFMNSMLEDLKSDTSLLAECVAYWNGINNSIDSVSDAIRFLLTKTDFAKAYRHLSNALNYYGFRYNDRTIAQLKNSGGFRLIRQKEVANKIILYDQLNQKAMVEINDQHNSLYMQTLTLRNKVFVQEIANELYRRYKYVPPSATINNSIDSMMQLHPIPFQKDEYYKLMFEFKNSLQALRKDFTNMDWGYSHERDQINNLMILIQQKYDLK